MTQGDKVKIKKPKKKQKPNSHETNTSLQAPKETKSSVYNNEWFTELSR